MLVWKAELVSSSSESEKASDKAIHITDTKVSKNSFIFRMKEKKEKNEKAEDNVPSTLERKNKKRADKHYYCLFISFFGLHQNNRS